ncbi:MAG: hypothetical protein FD163_976 [Hyphomonadaceae bacterium]|nr:MAG: hypothetical protein FD128_2556 [Hyphomonadaceae bacterium]KAF0186308.1 MAG: hypothetical protein FD163_976 [Hyphomonadaceae bacterium]
MWGKKSKAENEVAVVVANESETHAAETPKPRAQASVIAANANIMGSIVTVGDLAVDGKVDGDVRCSLFTVGATGHINGNVVAETATIRGKIAGNVTARTILLAGTGSIEGDLTHSVLIIEEGGSFDGRSKRQADPLADTQMAIADNSGGNTAPNTSQEDTVIISNNVEKPKSPKAASSKNATSKSTIAQELGEAFAATA